MRRALCSALLTAVVLAGGCDISLDLGGLFGSGETRVRLVNTGDFDVEVELYIGNQQEVLEAVLVATGEYVAVTVPAGETVTLTRDCDDLQAIIIDYAEVNLLLGLGPTQNTRVYRDGSDFDCGDRLTFTFSYPSFPTELNIDFDSGN